VTPSRDTSRVTGWLPLTALFVLWAILYLAAAATPPLLDDADATHAQAAQSMLRTHDFVILHVDGVPYLEKAPLPYWIAALSLCCFGPTSFAIHLPIALSVLALALLAFHWARRAFGERAAFLSGLFVLTSFGVFLFTRIFIPDILLSLWIALALYLFLRAAQPDCPTPAAHTYAAWSTLALAVLTKGLVALVFVLGAGLLFLLATRSLARLPRLRPVRGAFLFLAIAAPWHILAALRYPSTPSHRGFLWFYFVNEHVLRFLGRRIPADYNKLPAAAYWLLHLVWLFPWSLFLPPATLLAWQARNARADALELDIHGRSLSRLDLVRSRNAPSTRTFASQSTLLLALAAALILVFFAFSTNQEYYTLPAYLPLLLLLAAPLAQLPDGRIGGAAGAALSAAFAIFAALGALAAAALACSLWISRALPSSQDIGALMAHRAVGNYTLSLSHLFDLTGAAFAALRVPAALAAFAFLAGPALAWAMHARGRRLASLLSVAATSSVIMVAAHLALVRFTPLLSSFDFAHRIQQMEATGLAAPGSTVLLYGDQAEGSSIPFYLGHPVFLVDGRSTSMLFGSTLPNAPNLFLTHDQLRSAWGTGPRHLLFVPEDQRAAVDALLPQSRYLVMEESGKALFTDRPPAPSQPQPPPRIP
jgi:4-amino-4-deoxy-L-arabinose transferase-like glycosyltransferase